MCPEKIAYVLDFDGTITDSDITTALAHRFGGESYMPVEKAYRRGEYGMKVWLDKAAAFLPADLKLMLFMALEQAVIRPGFNNFLQYACTRANPVFIASDGFGFYIEPILQAHDCLKYIKRIFKNEATVNQNGKVDISPVHAHSSCPVCGNCKASHVIALKKEGYRVIYAGDGGNDRFGAFYADLIFARDQLARICRKKDVAFIPWQDFYDLIHFDSPAFNNGSAAPLCDPEREGLTALHRGMW